MYVPGSRLSRSASHSSIGVFGVICPRTMAIPPATFPYPAAGGQSRWLADAGSDPRASAMHRQHRSPRDPWMPSDLEMTESPQQSAGRADPCLYVLSVDGIPLFSKITAGVVSTESWLLPHLRIAISGRREASLPSLHMPGSKSRIDSALLLLVPHCHGCTSTQHKCTRPANIPRKLVIPGGVPGMEERETH